MQTRDWVEVTTPHGIVRVKPLPTVSPPNTKTQENRSRHWRAAQTNPGRSLLRIPENPMKYYLTTPIYYVNAAPHIGHAYTTLAADTIKRLKQMQGYTTVLTTGNDDEHGQKVERSAEAMGKTPEEFATIISNEFRVEWDRLGIQYDHFIRTTIRKYQRNWCAGCSSCAKTRATSIRAATPASTASLTKPMSMTRSRATTAPPAGAPPKPSPKRTTSSSSRPSLTA